MRRKYMHLFFDRREGYRSMLTLLTWPNFHSIFVLRRYQLHVLSNGVFPQNRSEAEETYSKLSSLFHVVKVKIKAWITPYDPDSTVFFAPCYVNCILPAPFA